MGFNLGFRSRAHIAKEILIGNRSKASGVIAELGWSDGVVAPKTQMLKAYSYMPWLRAVFGKIADGCGSAPWFFQAVSDSKKKDYVEIKQFACAGYDARKKFRSIIGKTTRIDDIYDHPMLTMLSAPNDHMSGPSLVALTALYIDLVGEALWWLERNNRGMPIRAWPIPPSWITERPSDKQEEKVFKLSAEGFPKEIPIEDVIWFRVPSPDSPYTKTASVAGPLTDELESDDYAAKHIKATFINGARPDIIISGTGLSPDENKRAEEKWLSKLRGYLKSHQPHFVGKDVSVHELTNNFNDLQLIELRRWQRDVVLQAAGMPPEILGIIESSNRATINAASYVYAKWVLIPRLELIRSTLQIQLVPQYDSRMVLEYFSPVEEDREFRIEVMKIAPWSWQADEWRGVVGDKPLPDGMGQLHFIPNSYSVQRTDELDEYISPYNSPELLEVIGDKELELNSSLHERGSKGRERKRLNHSNRDEESVQSSN